MGSIVWDEAMAAAYDATTTALFDPAVLDPAVDCLAELARGGPVLEFAVGMRLHFLIFAALRGTAFAALPYASKVTGLLEDLDMPTLPLGSIGIGQLIARIDRSWDTRADIRAKIRERVPALRERARQTNELLLRLLEKRGKDASATALSTGAAGPH